MTNKIAWTRKQLLLAFNLYCRMPFGKMHSRNPEIIEYAKLIGRTPAALAMKLTNIASLDPAITSTGRKGLQGASLTDREMWQEMQSNWGQFASLSLEVANEYELSKSQKVLSGDTDVDVDYTGSNKVVEAKVRIGQNFFRNSVLSAYEYKCCITGLAKPQLLVASHIIPWSQDEKNQLNPMNGLCLSMLHDKAFDIGIITIAEDMTVRVSKKATINSDQFFNSAILAYAGKAITLPEKFHPKDEFLAYHRKFIFENGERLS